MEKLTEIIKLTVCKLEKSFETNMKSQSKCSVLNSNAWNLIGPSKKPIERQNSKLDCHCMEIRRFGIWFVFGVESEFIQLIGLKTMTKASSGRDSMTAKIVTIYSRDCPRANLNIKKISKILQKVHEGKSYNNCVK